MAANATKVTRKPSVVYVQIDKEDGSFKLRNKSYEHVVDAAGQTQLAKNVKLVASEAGKELYKADIDGQSLFIVCKAGKAFTVNTAYEPVAPWASQPEVIFYGGVDSVKNRYDISMKKSFKAIDLITKDVELAGKRGKKSAIIEEAIATLSPEEQETVKNFNEIVHKMEAAKRKQAKEAKAAETPATDTEIQDIVADL